VAEALGRALDRDNLSSWRPRAAASTRITPDDHCGIAPGAVALRAFVDTRGHGAIAPHEIRWRSSLEGELGVGLDLIAQLGEGRHEITATAPDGIGGTLSERAIIIVGGRPQQTVR
jgi:hypothetical protein